MVCIFATAFLTFPYMTSNFESSHTQPSSLYDTLIHHKPPSLHQNEMQSSQLTWDHYYKYCQQPAWDVENRINVQLRCSQLDGILVKWEGTVVNVEISRVSNYRADFIFNYLPAFWSDMIACWYGDRNRVHCTDHEQNCDDMKAFLDEQKKCNLNNWNTYEYDIIVRMPSAGLLSRQQSEVILRGQHSFGNFTQRLNTSDRIWFKGSLRNTKSGGNGRGATTSSTNGNTGGSNTNGEDRVFMSLGKARPMIDLVAIGCISCPASNGLESFQVMDGLTVHGRVKDLYRGTKYLLNVLFNPLVTFK